MIRKMTPANSAAKPPMTHPIMLVMSTATAQSPRRPIKYQATKGQKAYLRKLSIFLLRNLKCTAYIVSRSSGFCARLNCGEDFELFVYFHIFLRSWCGFLYWEDS